MLRLALLEHGAPTAIVSDGGSIFKANQLLRIYKDLGIERRQIESGQAWQNYVETHFNIGRRMEDHALAQATTWAEMRAIHDRFFADYNLQPHWAHRHRTDGRRTPKAVLGPIHGVWCDEAELDRLFRLRSTRVFDASGYVRYKRWRLYGERGLAKQRGAVWLFGEVLSVAFEDDTLAQYRVHYDPETHRIADLTDARRYETGHASPQPFLWDLGDVEWHLVRRLRPYRRRQRPAPMAWQEPLFPEAMPALAGDP